MKKELELSFRNLKNKFLSLPVGVDIVFVILFGFVFDFVKYNIAAELENIIKIMGSGSIEIAPGIFSYSTLIDALKELPGFTGSYNTIMLNLVVFVVLVFVLWICLQSVSWWSAYKLNNIKVRFNLFLKRFFFKTIPYFVIGLVGLFVIIRIALSITLKGGVGEVAYNFFYAFVIVLGLLMFLSYAKIDDKLKNIIKSWRKIAWMYAISIILVLAAHFLLVYVGKLSYTAMLVVGAVVLMPLITYIRMFMVNVLKK